MVSIPQIRFKGKASRALEAERTQLVREHFNARDNAAVGPQMGF